MATKQLWDAEHPYYCSGGCYYAKPSECAERHESWASFLEEWKNADEDYNLLFRWDWREGSENAREDDELKDRARLELFYFQQRKARPFTVYVYVTRDDEPAVREFLVAKWQHMQRLWAPLGQPADTARQGDES